MVAANGQLRIFTRIVCGVDGTPASLVAVRQAIRLQAEDGAVQLMAVADVAQTAHAGMAASHAADLLQQEAERALAEAELIAPGAVTKLVDGKPVPALLREAEGASLVALGSHGRRRVAGMLLGTVAARMLRDAPCSVLIARAARNPESWPDEVVVGVDGSVGSGTAMTVAREVAERFGGGLRAVASTADQVDREAAHVIAPELEDAPAGAVDVLTAASERADLVVVGSRGLHGLKALGSVSERVAHRAHSSVLVVRSLGA